jgi:hypothetical protein
MRVQTRLVKRYFAEVAGKNKGFATRLGAYKALVKAELFDTVLGRGEGHYRENLKIPADLGIFEYTDEGNEWQKKRMGELFFDFGFQCDETISRYDGQPIFDCCPEAYAFCAYKYKALLGRIAKPPAFLVNHDGHVGCTYESAGTNSIPMIEVGKKAAGRILDGRTWDELPEAR